MVVNVGGECSRGDSRCDTSASSVLSAPEQPETPPPPLRVRIHSGGAERQDIPLTCLEPCATLTVAVEGGVSPYTIVWSDGDGSSVRHVCPSEATTYGIAVHDSSAVPSPSVARAAVTVRSAECSEPPPATNMPDAGSVTAPLGNEPDAGPLENCTTVAFEGRRRMPLTGACAAPAWMTLERQISAGRRHELRAFGRGLFVGRWRIELWGSSDGCSRVERLGEFTVGAVQVDTRIVFEPVNDHAMILLSVIEEADSERWIPYLGYTVCD
jgi:hypothetical protein